MNEQFLRGKTSQLQEIGTTCRKTKDIQLIQRNFPLDRLGMFCFGNMKVSKQELLDAQYITGGTMNAVFVLKDRKKVLKFNKPGILSESYEDVKKQLDIFRTFQENEPTKSFHIPETQIYQSSRDPEHYAMVAEYIEGRHLKISDIYKDPDVKKQVMDMGEAFTSFLKNWEYPIILDLMGAKQGVRCALYGLEMIDDFELANILITEEKKLVVVDTGLSFVKKNGWIRNSINIASSFGQLLTMYHIKTIASGKSESLIR